MAKVAINSDGRTLTVTVPMSFRRIGGRKQVVLPDGQAYAPLTRARIDNTIVKALARAFRWRHLLESGAYATVTELAAAEKINASYVSRVLRLTMLAPDIVEMILNGRQPTTLKLAELLAPFSVAWPEQRMRFGIKPGS